MKIEYGFGYGKLVTDKVNSEPMTREGDHLMFCRQDKVYKVSKIKEEDQNHRFTILLSKNDFSHHVNVTNELYLLCNIDYSGFNFSFHENVIYQFHKGLFRSIYSDHPWIGIKDQSYYKEKWDTTIFFMHGDWYSHWLFTSIPEIEAFEYKRLYDQKFNESKFDL